MTRLLAFALVVLPALPALANGRTFAVSTLASRGSLKLKKGEAQITVRAPLGLKLSRETSGTFVPESGVKNAARTHLLFKVGTGKYYASSPVNEQFKIKK